MDQGQLLFYERLRRLAKTHRALARGYRARMRADGLIVLMPKRQFVSISPRPLASALLVLVVLKGFLIASLGSQGYGDRLAQLQVGTGIERAGAAIMQVDPVSNAVSRLFVLALR